MAVDSYRWLPWLNPGVMLCHLSSRKGQNSVLIFHWNWDHIFPDSELLFYAKPNIVPQYGLRMTPGFSADHARILMCSNSQAPLHTYTHMGLHTLAQRRDFPHLCEAIGASRETTGSRCKMLTVSNFSPGILKSQGERERERGRGKDTKCIDMDGLTKQLSHLSTWGQRIKVKWDHMMRERVKCRKQRHKGNSWIRLTVIPRWTWSCCGYPKNNHRGD